MSKMTALETESDIQDGRTLLYSYFNIHLKIGKYNEFTLIAKKRINYMYKDINYRI